MNILKIIGLATILAIANIVKAQAVSPGKSWNDYPFSIYAGFGTQKFASRFDYNIGPPAFRLFEGSHHVYLDLGISSKQFKLYPQFPFGNVFTYKSNTAMLFVGLGYGFHYQMNRYNLQADLGLRYGFVRFTDPDLVEAIGSNGIIRPDGQGGIIGPTVANAYGNAVGLDIALRAGYRLTDRLELNGGLSLCPIRFSSGNTLFGKYYGEAPYLNRYWVRVFPLRVDVGLRLYFEL